MAFDLAAACAVLAGLAATLATGLDADFAAGLTTLGGAFTGALAVGLAAALAIDLVAALLGAATLAAGLDTVLALAGAAGAFLAAAVVPPWVRPAALPAGAALTVLRVAAFTTCLLSDPDERDV